MKVCLTHFHSTKHLNFSVSIAKYLNHESIDVCFITNKVFIKKVIEDKYIIGIAEAVEGIRKVQNNNMKK